MSNFTAKRTSTPDPVSGHTLATLPTAAASGTLAPIVGLMQDSLGNKPAVHRSGIATDDTGTTDMSTGGFGATGLFDLTNSSQLLFWGESNTSAAPLRVVPIYYSLDAFPMFEGTPVTLCSTARRVTAVGNYMTALHALVPAPGARYVRLYVLSVTGSWNLYLASL